MCVNYKVESRVSETDMEDVLEKHKPWHNTQGKESANAYMSEAGFIAAFLRRVDLLGAKLIGVDLSGAYLS